MSAFERCTCPVVAAVHGHCVGAGVDMVTACDIRLATQGASFSVKEADIAIGGRKLGVGWVHAGAWMRCGGLDAWAGGLRTFLAQRPACRPVHPPTRRSGRHGDAAATAQHCGARRRGGAGAHSTTLLRCAWGVGSGVLGARPQRRNTCTFSSCPPRMCPAGAEAKELRLVSQTYKGQEELLAAATALAQQLAAKSPLALAGTKRVLLYQRRASKAPPCPGPDFALGKVSPSSSFPPLSLLFPSSICTPDPHPRRDHSVQDGLDYVALCEQLRGREGRGNGQLRSITGLWALQPQE